ncbi:hypothetical protein T03_10559 [Trichinella britovi]|uniref:Uncharacterized protein n=1 Tax=Trichinella britovi TaxID=45882 RepID=A0A0V1C343_TRIBR|nr:hypothetical protein T03_10559 [Trichinella britovi]
MVTGTTFHEMFAFCSKNCKKFEARNVLYTEIGSLSFRWKRITDWRIPHGGLKL